jgi:hypothetical protein
MSRGATHPHMSDGKRLERPRRTPCQSEIADTGNPRAESAIYCRPGLRS